MYLRGDEIDKRVGWPLGRADKLARKRLLPHLLLPDGAIRFQWDEISPLIVPVPAGTGGLDYRRGSSQPVEPRTSRAR